MFISGSYLLNIVYVDLIKNGIITKGRQDANTFDSFVMESYLNDLSFFIYIYIYKDCDSSNL